jgi:hypothetical protein
MNENQIAQQLIDQLRFYNYGARGTLQSPGNQEAWRQLYGAASSEPVQQGTRQAIQKGSLGALGKAGAGIMGYLNKPINFNPPLTPAQAAMLVGGMMLDERNQNKAREQYIQDNLQRQAIQQKLKNMPMEIKTDPRYIEFLNRLQWIR